MAPTYLCVMKSPNFLVDMNNTMERKELSSSMTHLPFLGHKASSKDENMRWGEDERRQGMAGAEKQEASSIGPAQKDFSSHCSCHPSTPREVNMNLRRTHNTGRKELGIPHYQQKSIFNFLDFCLV